MSTDPAPCESPPDAPGRHIVVRALGCKVSRIDAGAIARALGARPGRRDDVADADVLLVHTCSVTDRADRDDRRLIRRLRRENPRALLVVSGCLAQRDPEALARMPEVDLVVGHGAHDLPSLLLEREAGLLPGKVAWRPADAGGEFFGGPDLPGGAAARALVEPGRTRAFLKVQDGCERRCAFCVVPSLRGKERSVPTRDVEVAIRRLGDEGIPEVVLAGVHLANYGKDRGESLLGLLRRLEADAPPCRVRLSSLEPMEAGEELVAFVAGSRIVAPHLHLPVQSGSDRVLKRMRRGLTAARIARLFFAAHRANPRVHLATDLIAGFPGETDEEHAETRALVTELPLASLHVFPFSPRSGTEAARQNTERPVPRAAVTRRAAELRRLGDGKRGAFSRRADGTLAEVVVLFGGRGLTDHYLDVSVRPGPGGAPAPGRRLLARLSLGSDGISLEAAPVSAAVPEC